VGSLGAARGLDRQYYVNDAVTAAESKGHSFFEDTVERWRSVRESFLSAARRDLDLDAAAWWSPEDPTASLEGA
jgi:hypothetical protein